MAENSISIVQNGHQSISTDLRQFELALLSFMETHGLPSESILVSIRDRQTVFQNIGGVLERIGPEQRLTSAYLSKFVAAVASGLFDAALNYLWDETIFELRKRVSHYDLAYFFDVAVGNNPDKRKKLNSEEDLQKIDDSELIRGASEIGLISDLGYRHLDYIRYMRNWASAAHPNQNQITGLQLISMLETCIIEVIKLPLSNVVVEIKQLLANIKTNKITNDEATQIATFFTGLTQERANTLASGFFGIYTQVDTAPQTRQNVQLLIPRLWVMVDENTRQQFGIRYARFVAANDQDRQKFARQFLDVVSGISYLPQGILVAEIETAIDNLLTAHRSSNNFYNEPTFAKQLQRLIGDTGNVPLQINRKYVHGLVEVFLTNGNGKAWNAEPAYVEMLEQFSATQATIAVLTFTDQSIASRLQFPLCQNQFKQLLVMMQSRITIPVVQELITDIESFTGPLDKMKDDIRFKRKVETIKKIVSG